MSTLISVPGGRCIRRSQQANWVDPQPEKGLIELKLDDDLMHLWWKNRVTQSIEDDLIIFPGEATFEKVQQDPSGLTYILKFSSSDQKYFFWFQSLSRDGDLRAAFDINALIQDSSYVPGSAPLPDVAPSTPTDALNPQDRSWPPTPGAPKLSHPEPAPPTRAGPSSTPAPVGGASNADMARLLAEWAQSGGLGPVTEDARLTDILTPANISNLLASKPSLLGLLAPLLPSELNLGPTPTAQQLLPILTAPQFTDAIASLDNALRSGGLPGGMMRELGLPESAGRGVKEFLEGLKGLHQGGAGGGDRMDED